MTPAPGDSRPARHVLVVRPQPRPPLSPSTSFDPKFSRALDFKLRRLKEKEILESNLRRPTHRRDMLSVSEPDISTRDRRSPRVAAGGSHPQPSRHTEDKSHVKKLGKTPSPGRRPVLLGVSEGIEMEKPRFITTVKTGRFLLPPPELARLFGLEPLYSREREPLVYSYSSRPKAVATRSKRNVADGQQVGDVVRTRRRRAGDVFRGVRTLVAGVVGLSGSVGGGASYGNVMHEPRVVRGSTFAAHPHAAGDGLESAAARAARARRRAFARRAAAARLRPGTPPPAPGRYHRPIQTEYYLEELFDKGVEMSVGVQTDLFVDRPASPHYVPAKTGADAYTQIYSGDLFDFDLEVQPILEVLIGKTVEQALAETAQEEELATLREHQRRFLEMRDAERAERERLARQDVRLHNEKERRVAAAREAKVSAIEARERAAAGVLVQGYVAELLPSVLAGLRDSGYLLERIQRGVDEEFLPWLAAGVARELHALLTGRDLVTEIVREVAEARADLYLSAGERAAARVEPADSVTPPSVMGEGGEEGWRPPPSVGAYITLATLQWGAVSHAHVPARSHVHVPACSMDRGGRVAARRGLPRGATSRPFSTPDLLHAARDSTTDTVYIELDNEGRLVTAGGGGAARATVRARLAPHVHAADAHVVYAADTIDSPDTLSAPDNTSAPDTPRQWALRLLADLPPHHDLQLWFSEEVLAAVDMPFLTLQNIRGKKNYACHKCGAQFEQPNPLKVHLFLSCREFTPRLFWRRFTGVNPGPAWVLPTPATLEALAAAWGRARGGHVCVYCGKLYSRKYGLKIHIRTHTGYKPLRCRHCSRAFGDPSNLNKHVRLHASEGVAKGGVSRALACALCGKMLARRRDLDRHVRTQHPPSSRANVANITSPT